MKATERLEARRLRGEGRSIKEIAQGCWSREKFGFGVGCGHCLDRGACPRLPEERQQRTREYIVSRSRSLRTAAAERHAAYRRHGFEIAAADARFRVICALYWGEGRKTSRDAHFAVSNADPRLLRVILRWLLDSGYREKLSFRVQYYPANGYTEDEIKQWWLGQLAGLESQHLRKFTRIEAQQSESEKESRLLALRHCVTASLQYGAVLSGYGRY